MIRIDGSHGEGGGQILRSSLSLSLATGKPFIIENVRANRQRGGLLRQHLTAVLAAAEIGGADVEGAELGSTRVAFTPKHVRGGEYRFAIGTAGSATLVLQTLLPALMLASEPSRVIIDGGTHNHAAPPADFLAKAFLPLIGRMGPHVEFRLERYGFYPAGGGRILAKIQPVRELTPLVLGERTEICERRAVALVANLARGIAEREVKALEKKLNWPHDCFRVEQTKDSAGPGNIVMVEVTSHEVTEVFSSFGEIGVPAERVAVEAANEARGYLASKAVAGEHLTDQLLLPIALAGSGEFTAMKLSRHARTNMEVIGHFLPVHFDTTNCEGYTRVALRPSAGYRTSSGKI